MAVIEKNLHPVVAHLQEQAHQKTKRKMQRKVQLKNGLLLKKEKILVQAQDHLVVVDLHHLEAVLQAVAQVILVQDLKKR